MTTQNNEEVLEPQVNSFNWQMNAADSNQDDKDLEREEDDEEEESDEEVGDWGDVDPAGGPAPTAPGSAV